MSTPRLTARDWEQRLEHLAASGYPTLVVVDDQTVVGYALLMPWLAKPAFARTAENSIYLSSTSARPPRVGCARSFGIAARVHTGAVMREHQMYAHHVTVGR